MNTAGRKRIVDRAEQLPASVKGDLLGRVSGAGFSDRHAACAGGGPSGRRRHDGGCWPHVETALGASWCGLGPGPHDHSVCHLRRRHFAGPDADRPDGRGPGIRRRRHAGPLAQTYCAGCGRPGCISTCTPMATDGVTCTPTAMPAPRCRMPGPARTCPSFGLSGARADDRAGARRRRLGRPLALAVAATRDAWTAVGYVAVFGLGSILGMAALSFVAAWPLGAAERHAKWLDSGLSLAAAGLAVALGAGVMAEIAGAAWGRVLISTSWASPAASSISSRIMPAPDGPARAPCHRPAVCASGAAQLLFRPGDRRHGPGGRCVGIPGSRRRYFRDQGFRAGGAA